MRRKVVKRHQTFDISPIEYDGFRERFISLLEKEESVSTDYLLEVFESKLLDPRFSSSPRTRRTKAVVKWLRCEEKNDTTNHRICFDLDTLIGGRVSAGDVALWCQNLVKKTIGAEPDWDSLRGSFSGGASTSIKRGPGTIGSKYMRGKDITASCVPHFERLNVSSWWNPEYNIVPGNVLFTVPKSVSIDRCAAKEPDLNMYVQKSVGNYFRGRLLRRGINLNDQTINQKLAHEGSLHGNLATIDLSSASDSITTMFVAQLLPPSWFSLLMDIRSPSTFVEDYRVKGHWHDNQMISSMGNAYTFELESLLFWALTRAACYFTGSKGRVSIYGDDIICPTGAVEFLVELLSFFGFSVNADKSFWDGPFRESCGKHYHAGRDVTPFFVRKVPVNVSDWIHLLNSLRHWLDRHSIVEILDPDYYQLWFDYQKLVPVPVKGGWDYERRDILVSPGRRPLARIRPKQVYHRRIGRQLQLGLYIAWLDTSDREPDRRHAIETSDLRSDGPLAYSRARKESWSVTTPRFPQEWGVEVDIRTDEGVVPAERPVV